jgi:hypothetical protein
MVAATMTIEELGKMNRHTARFLALAAATTIIGCASSGSAPKTSEASRDNITSIEINATSAQSAYDLVNKLRPQWLRQSGVSSIGSGRATAGVILVYLDGNRIGSVETLRTITASGIKNIQWLSATRAAVVLPDIGSDAVAGAISIKTR